MRPLDRDLTVKSGSPYDRWRMSVKYDRWEGLMYGQRDWDFIPLLGKCRASGNRGVSGVSHVVRTCLSPPTPVSVHLTVGLHHHFTLLNFFTLEGFYGEAEAKRGTRGGQQTTAIKDLTKLYQSEL